MFSFLFSRLMKKRVFSFSRVWCRCDVRYGWHVGFFIIFFFFFLAKNLEINGMWILLEFRKWVNVTKLLLLSLFARWKVGRKI